MRVSDSGFFRFPPIRISPRGISPRLENRTVPGTPGLAIGLRYWRVSGVIFRQPRPRARLPTRSFSAGASGYSLCRNGVTAVSPIRRDIQAWPWIFWRRFGRVARAFFRRPYPEGRVMPCWNRELRHAYGYARCPGYLPMARPRGARSPAIADFRWGCFRSSALPWPPFGGFSLRGEAAIELLERNSGEPAFPGPRFYNRQTGIALIPGCSSAHLRHSRVSSAAFRQHHPKARLSSCGASPATLTE
jgi:hypothetical protein